MTKKDYEAIAKILKSLVGQIPQDDPDGELIDNAVNQFADYFESKSPKFDRNRFLEASGMPVIWNI